VALVTDAPARTRAGDPVPPRRVLIVSATVGEGHNATGRALEQEIRRLWPECDVRWIDALDVMAPGLGSLARGAYVGGVESTPGVYDFFYQATRDSRPFTAVTKAIIGAWCGRRLAPVITAYAPDVIISTYPLGSTGLAWLRRHRGLNAALAAWVSDFAPHPFWVYGDLDLTYVMDDHAVPLARTADPGANVKVAALPVGDGFAGADRARARRGLGLAEDGFVAVLSTGCYGFGSVETAVDALLGAHPSVRVVVVCGRNERLLRRLRARRADDRLTVLGWVDDMPGYIAASDVVVTNAGGATALEAVAAERTVLMYQPIAGQGRANADLMRDSGLALLCATPEELAITTARLCAEPARRAATERHAREAAQRRERADDLRELATWQAPRGPVRVLPRPEEPLRAEDAFFLYTQTPWVSQQIGAVLKVDGDVDRAELTARAATLLHRRKLAPGPHWWSRPVWEERPYGNAGGHVREVRPGRDGMPGDLDGIIDAFYSVPIHGLWDIWLARDLPGGRSAVLVKVHHAVGDSFAVAATLIRLLDPVDGGRKRRPSVAAAPPAPRRERIVAAAREAGRIAAGFSRLAFNGPAPKSGVSGRMDGPERRFVSFTVPSRELMSVARRQRVGSTALILTMVGDAVSRVLAERGGPSGTTVRVMVPRTVRPSGAGEELGNWTAAVPVDLPVGPMSRGERLTTVQKRFDDMLASGVPSAASWVMRAMKVLPAPVHSAASRAIYNGNWFNMIVSVFPGHRVPRTMFGSRVSEVFPVLPLASEVGLAVGAMTWGADFSFGITADEALVPDAERLGELARECYDELGALPDAHGVTAESGSA
jgi:WS/DGAT/MGAT family acyltransferase